MAAVRLIFAPFARNVNKHPISERGRDPALIFTGDAVIPLPETKVGLVFGKRYITDVAEISAGLKSERKRAT